MQSDYEVLGESTFTLDGEAALQVQCKRCKTYAVVTHKALKKSCEVCQAELKQMGRNK